jgi:hypothetical protein
MIGHEEIYEIAGEIFSRNETKFLELYKKNQKYEILSEIKKENRDYNYNLDHDHLNQVYDALVNILKDEQEGGRKKSVKKHRKKSVKKHRKKSVKKHRKKSVKKHRKK